MVRKRVAIIGLDGASLDLIQRWAKEGHLPNLKRLIDEGATGYLRSTIPPFTPTAWTSAVTGKNPGKHGIFGFTSRWETGNNMYFNSSLDRRADPLWLILDRHGMKSIVLKVPMTYPPDRFGGVMISDVPLSFNWQSLDFKRSSDAMFEPRYLKMELEDEFGSVSQWLDKKKYKGLKRDGMDPAQRLHLFKEASGVFCGINSYLIKRYKWSFFMYVEPITDYFGHKCFPIGNGANAGNGDTVEDHILRKAYVIADRSVGAILRVIDGLEGESTIIIMSDHGMVPSYSVFHLNRWLKEMGLLKYTVTRAHLKKMINTAGQARPPFKDSQLLSFFIDMMEKGPDHIPVPVRGMIKEFFKWLVTSRGGGLVVDWKDSAAVACNYQQIKFLQREGSKEQKAAEDLVIRSLMGLKDPRTGGPVIGRILHRDMLYKGPYTKDAPQLSLLSKDRHCFLSTYHSPGPLSNIRREGKTGIHDQDGVVIINGPGIKRGASIKGAKILDIAPTVLYALDLPVIPDMDGRVISSAYTHEYRVTHPLRIMEDEGQKKVRSENEKGRRSDVYSAQEKEHIKDMLHDLGYIG